MNVSELKFWKTDGASTDQKKTSGDGGAFLSYDTFLAFSVLGGFFGLDHLYLRSPLTAIAKFIVNLFCFGLWWFYDAIQAIFHRDVIKVYGLGVPGFGPKGIASGVLAADEPDKKHYQFLLYGLAVLVGGGIGLDSFLLSDRRNGFIRLACMLSVILAPVALLWWAYQSFRFLADTEDVVRENAAFFGAPASEGMAKWAARFPLLGLLFSPMEWAQRALAGILGPALGPVQAAADAVKGATATVDGVVAVASKALDKGAEITGNLKGVVEDAVAAAEHLSDASPVTSMYAAADAAGLTAASEPGQKGGVGQKGGAGGAVAIAALALSDLHPLHILLVSTIVFIVVAGFYSTYQKHDTRDDTPPEPGVFRVPDLQGNA